MHRPVAAAFGIFARPVERIDDPHAGLFQPHRIVDAFFGEHAVVGALRLERFEDEGIGDEIARLAERLAGDQPAVAQIEQQAARGLGDLRGELGVAGQGMGVGHQAVTSPVISACALSR